jgi:hypothetical protein
MICGSVSVEEEIAILGHYCILKVNGGWINRVVLKVREQKVPGAHKHIRW